MGGNKNFTKEPSVENVDLAIDEQLRIVVTLTHNGDLKLQAKSHGDSAPEITQIIGVLELAKLDLATRQIGPVQAQESFPDVTVVIDDLDVETDTNNSLAGQGLSVGDEWTITAQTNELREIARKQYISNKQQGEAPPQKK